MQNQTNVKHSSSPEDIFKSDKNFLEIITPREESSRSTVSKFQSKTPNRSSPGDLFRSSWDLVGC